MKFIVDDAIHTLDFPQQNLTEDGVSIRLSVQQQRIVIFMRITSLRENPINS